MKRGLLLLLGMFMMVSTVEAKSGEKLTNRYGFNYSYSNAVNFVERGIEFFVFTNGEFDFDTQLNDNYYYNNNRVSISRDYRGRIRRIGSAYVNYDRYGNVTRIGNVFMRYYRGNLTKVGNLRVSYDYWGNPSFFGNVKNNYFNYDGFRINLNLGDICDYNDTYFYRNDFRRNYSRIKEDKNYYYYRANPNAKIGKRSKTLRRRKPASTILNSNKRINTRRNSSTYRKPSTVDTKRNKVTRNRSNTYRKPITTKRKEITKNRTNTYRKPITTKRKIDKKVIKDSKKRNKNTRRRS